MNKWERLRVALYGLGSVVLKVAAIEGLLTEDKSQVYLLLISAVLDLAFVMVLPLRSGKYGSFSGSFDPDDE